ncbi:MAG: hypothetical protein E6767_17285 [Dysgonomonas sp.]|nr:hypothetical protein [Dysgonomonas sp.]
MNVLKHLVAAFFLSFTGFLLPLAAQTYTEVYPGKRILIGYEKFDVNTIRNKYKGKILNYTYTKTDGTKVRIASYEKNSNIEVFEFAPAPFIYMVYKEFYPNGNLKQKGVCMPLQVRVGKWLQCDRNGRQMIVDYTQKCHLFDYNDVLKYLEQCGYYNTNSYEARNLTYRFWYTPETGQWGVRLSKDDVQFKRFIFDQVTGYLAQEEELYDNPIPPRIYESFFDNLDY